MVPTPHDLWFRIFYDLGILALVLVVVWGAFVVYDARKEDAGEGRDGED